ncbi:hypothetical protein HUB98_09435 [Paenibacillus barcinonensis]|uniref:Uncharacterized protein n=1 Tax=Paenibacillus barcinonensis TaxID=198119 RepID=A0A2V4VAB3_PAEBA|nr:MULTISPECIES: hypothetical protein [Paenibacillus]MBT2284256.1 hypothetical protein [Paenibacillus polymyxa]PYE49771.1 hypothetical protein DFQ00_105275 [Paenibacillus barcinonensis]QKS56539.1 hypothetical protein HUB98_09435 [Paenibacillus barcinonensis]
MNTGHIEVSQWIESIKNLNYRGVLNDRSIREDIETKLNLTKAEGVIQSKNALKTYDSIMETYIYKEIKNKTDYRNRNKKFLNCLNKSKNIDDFTMNEIFGPELSDLQNRNKQQISHAKSYIQNAESTPENHKYIEKESVIELVKKYGISDKESTIKRWMQPDEKRIKAIKTRVGRQQYLSVKQEDMIEYLGNQSEVHQKLFKLAETDSPTIKTDELRYILGKELFE